MKSYSELAPVYDQLMSHVNFKGVTEFYLDLARLHKWKGRHILDLACGTGNITLELFRQGYSVTGIDLSEDMLTMAEEKVRAAGFKADFYCQNMINFQVPGTYDLVISAFDSLNYILEERELKQAITGIHKALTPGGLFIFDVHSEYKFKEVFGNNTFTYSSPEYSYIWQNRYDNKKNVCSMSLDIHIQVKKDLYRRIEEYHQERCYSPEQLETLLEDNGLKVLAVYGDQKMKKPGPKAERIFFVAQKAGAASY